MATETRAAKRAARRALLVQEREEWRKEVGRLWRHRHANSPIVEIMARQGIRYAIKMIRACDS